MSVVYPTTQVVDGITSQSLDIPKCIQLEDGTYYCFDYRNRLVSIQPNNPVNSVNASPLNNRKYNIISVDRITSVVGLFIDGNLVSLKTSPTLGSGDGYFVNNNIHWKGWASFVVFSGSPTPGTNGAYGSAVTLFSNVNQSPRSMIVPLFLSITWGGTFASGETVSVEVSFTIVYGTLSPTTLGTGTLTASATSTGTQNFGCAQIYAVIAPYLNSNYNYPTNSLYAQYISQITAAAASSATSTSVTVTVTVVGFYT